MEDYKFSIGDVVYLPSIGSKHMPTIEKVKIVSRKNCTLTKGTNLNAYRLHFENGSEATYLEDKIWGDKEELKTEMIGIINNL